MASWVLAIDFGTTSTAAARRVGDRVELIQLEGAPRMPSMVFWREGTEDPSAGRLVLGQEADELSTLAPWCLERAPKRRLGDELMQLGEKELRVVDVIAQILRRVTDEAFSLSGGATPSEIRLTHPVRWGKRRLEKLRQAARIAGINDPVFVPEPVAAAVHFASEKLAVGEHVAVYDLGGGTFDTAVLERTEGSFVVVGRPGGEEELGGEDLDDLLYRHLGEQLEAQTWQALRGSDARKERVWAQANREFLRHARRAKEGLSRKPDYEFFMPPPIDQELHASAREFEQLIAKDLRHTVVELERTILAANLKPSDLTAIYMAGGSSRTPLVGRLIQEHLGILPEHLDDPKAVIALGAARLAEVEGDAEPDLETPPKPVGVPIQDPGETLTAPLAGDRETELAGRGQPVPAEPTLTADSTKSPAPAATRPAEVQPTPAALKGAAGEEAARERGPRSKAKFNRKIAGIVVASLFLLAGLVATGIALTGGDDNSNSTVADMIASADEICLISQREFFQARAKYPTAKDDIAAAESYSVELIQISKKALRGLRKLEPPPDIAKPFEAYVKARKQAYDYVLEARAAAVRGDLPGFREELQKSEAEGPQRYRLARKAELSQCSPNRNPKGLISARARPNPAAIARFATPASRSPQLRARPNPQPAL